MSEDAAAADQQHDDGEDVRHVQEDGAAGGVGAEGDRGAEVQEPEQDVEDEGEEYGAHWDVQAGGDVRETRGRGRVLV